MYLFWAYPFAAVAFLVNFVVSVIPYFILYFFRLKKIATSWLFINNRLLSGFLFFLVGLNLDIMINSESEKLIREGKGLCFISNHTSILDIPAVVYSTKAKTGFIAKKQVSAVPFIHLLAVAMKCVFINRKSRKESIKSIEQGIKVINEGHSMLIFPEGTRSKTGEIAPFKPGSFRLAMESESMIVPISLKGLRAAFEDRKSCFKRYKGYIVVGAPVLIKMSEDRFDRANKISLIEKEIRETYASLGDK